MGLGVYLHGTKFINVNMNNIIPLWPKTIESQMPTRDSHINQSLYHKKHLHPQPPPPSFFSFFSSFLFFSDHLRQWIYSPPSIIPLQTHRVSTVSSPFQKGTKWRDAYHTHIGNKFHSTPILSSSLSLSSIHTKLSLKIKK